MCVTISLRSAYGVSPPGDTGRRKRPNAGAGPPGYFFIRSFTGSFTFSTLSISTLRS